jgi:RNA polymerase sigma-70 factor (ECF subfamily)
MSEHEEELARRIAGGDAKAFDELYEAYKRPIANLLYRLCFDRILVDDLLQEVFVRLWRGCRTFRGESKISTFIFRIAYNVWFNEARRGRESPTGNLDHGIDASEPSEGVENRERRASVQEAIRSLPPREQAVLILSEYNNLPYEEISEILEIPVGTVKSRMHSALRRMREQLKDRV